MSKYKENVELIKELNSEEIDKKCMNKATIFSTIILIIIASFVFIILKELFKQYSSVTFMFKILVIIFSILVFSVCPLYATITVMIYKYYSKNELIHQVKWYYSFIYELTRIGNLVFSIIATTVLTILLLRLAG